MIEAESMTQVKPFERLLLALVGKEKAWKSRTAATGRKPVLFFDFDGRRASVAGVPDVYAITLRDPQGVGMMPTAFSDLLDILTALETNPDLSELKFMVDGQLKNLFPTAPKGTIPKTIVFPDSVRTCGNSARAYALYTNPALRREISIGGKMVIHLSKSWDGWQAEVGMVEKGLLRVMGLPWKPDVISIFHETEEETGDSTAEKPKYTGRVGLYPVRYQGLIAYFNEVWRMALQQPVGDDATSNPNKWVARAQTAPDSRFLVSASTMRVDQFEIPDISAMIEKHLAREKALGIK